MKFKKFFITLTLTLLLLFGISSISFAFADNSLKPMPGLPTSYSSQLPYWIIYWNGNSVSPVYTLAYTNVPYRAILNGSSYMTTMVNYATTSGVKNAMAQTSGNNTSWGAFPTSAHTLTSDEYDDKNFVLDYIVASNYNISTPDNVNRYTMPASKSIISTYFGIEAQYIKNQSAVATIVIKYDDGSIDFKINNGGAGDNTLDTTDANIISITQNSSTLDFNETGTATISTVVNNIPISKTISVIDPGFTPITDVNDLIDSPNVFGDKPILLETATWEEKVSYYLGLVIYYICAPINFLVYLLGELFIAIQNLLGGVGNLLSLMGKFLTWLPSPLPALISTAIIMTIILKILKR